MAAGGAVPAQSVPDQLEQLDPRLRGLGGRQPLVERLRQPTAPAAAVLGEPGVGGQVADRGLLARRPACVVVQRERSSTSKVVATGRRAACVLGVANQACGGQSAPALSAPLSWANEIVS